MDSALKHEVSALLRRTEDLLSLSPATARRRGGAPAAVSQHASPSRRTDSLPASPRSVAFDLPLKVKLTNRRSSPLGGHGASSPTASHSEGDPVRSLKRLLSSSRLSSPRGSLSSPGVATKSSVGLTFSQEIDQALQAGGRVPRRASSFSLRNMPTADAEISLAASRDLSPDRAKLQHLFPQSLSGLSVRTSPPVSPSHSAWAGLDSLSPTSGRLGTAFSQGGGGSALRRMMSGLSVASTLTTGTARVASDRAKVAAMLRREFVQVPELRRYKANVASQDAAPSGLVDLEAELDEAAGALAKKLTGNWTALESQVRQKFQRLLKTGLDEAFENAMPGLPPKVKEAVDLVTQQRQQQHAPAPAAAVQHLHTQQQQLHTGLHQPMPALPAAAVSPFASAAGGPAASPQHSQQLQGQQQRHGPGYSPGFSSEEIAELQQQLGAVLGTPGPSAAPIGRSPVQGGFGQGGAQGSAAGAAAAFSTPLPAAWQQQSGAQQQGQGQQQQQHWAQQQHAFTPGFAAASTPGSVAPGMGFGAAGGAPPAPQPATPGSGDAVKDIIQALQRLSPTVPPHAPPGGSLYAAGPAAGAPSMPFLIGGHLAGAQQAGAQPVGAPAASAALMAHIGGLAARSTTPASTWAPSAAVATPGAVPGAAAPPAGGPEQAGTMAMATGWARGAWTPVRASPLGLMATPLQ